MKVYFTSNKQIKDSNFAINENLPENLIWIDLLDINKEEEQRLEELFQIDIPTIEETRNIAISNRLYEANNAIYMTFSFASLDAKTKEIKSHILTFIIKGNILLTVRYAELDIFTKFFSYIKSKEITSDNLTLALLSIFFEKIINETSSILEYIGHKLDRQNNHILKPHIKSHKKFNNKNILEELAESAHIISIIRESLISFNRAIIFISQSELQNYKSFKDHLEIFSKDISALSDHANFLSGKVTFLLEATLGLINIEQNKIIKMFSVVSVVLMPPTLIASIYGMNFEFMPELKWIGGYPVTIVIMLLSSWLPYKYFKSKNWF